MEKQKTGPPSPLLVATIDNSVTTSDLSTNKNEEETVLCLHRCILFRVICDPAADRKQSHEDEFDWDQLIESVKNSLAAHIDNLGQQSARAQKLKSSITTYGKLMQNPDSEYLYFLLNQQSIPKGYIRICKKNLFLSGMDQLEEYENCLCVMDFFVVERREGTGLKLMISACKDLDLQPKDLLIDRPSEAMINFMKKHFNLKPLHHYNKFASFV